eukprot:4699769-Amphidinium_carterae.1
MRRPPHLVEFAANVKIHTHYPALKFAYRSVVYAMGEFNIGHAYAYEGWLMGALCTGIQCRIGFVGRRSGSW